MIIRKATVNDFGIYADLLQRTYQVTYADDKLGLKKEYFDKKYWQTKLAEEYLKSHLVNSETRGSWLAFVGNKLVGAISCKNQDDNTVWLSGFYVDVKYQGMGIGKKLYQLVLDFAQKKELQLEVYAHNVRTIDIYKKWGWIINVSKGNNGYYDLHWEKWPEGLVAKCMFMKLVRNI